VPRCHANLNNSLKAICNGRSSVSVHASFYLIEAFFTLTYSSLSQKLLIEFGVTLRDSGTRFYR
jgi:hypothetical protein